MSAGRQSLVRAFVCLACVLPLVRAQNGVVKSNGLPLPGATVTATLGGRRLTTVTDPDGRYAFDGLTPGTWAMQVDLFGFDTAGRQVEIGAQSVATEWTLELGRPPGRPGARSPGGFQTVQNQVEPQLNEGAQAETAPPAGAGPDPATDTTEAFLVNGSVSRGLQQGDFETGPPGMDMMRMGRMGAPGGDGFGGGGFGGPGGGGNRGPGQGNQRNASGRRPLGPGGPGPFFGNRAGRGQQQICGMATFTVRNSAFDAAPYSLNGQNAVKPSYDQFRWGLSIGGPLVIKHLVQSPATFFFINYFGTKADSPFRGVTTVPTEAWRNWDFSGLGTTLYDPANRTPFENNGSRSAAS